MSPVSEMFVSELIGNPVVDRAQENIGRVKDILISQGEKFPKVTGLLIATGGRKKEIHILSMGMIDLIGTKFISTRGTEEAVAFVPPGNGESLLLMRDVVDQQVVDLEGARVIRVNDLKLAKVNQDLRLIAADVGFRGMFRRLGLEKFISKLLKYFGKEIPEQLIGWDHVQSLAEGKIAISSKSMTNLHPADVAQIISQLNADDKTAILSLLSEEMAAEALHELEPMLAAVLIANLDTPKALRILEKMPINGVADVLGDLPPEKSSALLAAMRPRKGAQVRELLKHKDETAGGLMRTDFITLRNDLTAEQVIETLRRVEPSAEAIYYLYVTDATENLVGILPLRKLIVAPPTKPIVEFMISDPITVSPGMNQREVATIISKYNLLAVPVVDENQKILGIITVDDVLDFILPPLAKRKRKMIG